MLEDIGNGLLPDQNLPVLVNVIMCFQTWGTFLILYEEQTFP
jgi:hypothetical protein